MEPISGKSIEDGAENGVAWRRRRKEALAERFGGGEHKIGVGEAVRLWAQGGGLWRRKEYLGTQCGPKLNSLLSQPSGPLLSCVPTSLGLSEPQSLLSKMGK